MISHMWNRKFDTNEPIYYETETESGTQRTDSWLPGGYGWERVRLGVWISTCELAHTEWRNSKVPLQSRGNSSQHPLINHNGKEYEKNVHTLFYYVLSFPWRRKCQPTLVFLHGSSHGQRSLVGCSLWCCKELDTTQYIYTHTYVYNKLNIYTHTHI